MNAAEFFDAGRLGEAVEAQTQVVRGRPADPNARLFLFELLAFAGDWDRARRQIDAVHYGELPRDNAVLQYRLALDAEEARRKVFAESGAPEFLADPPPHLAPRLEALRHLRAGRPADALRDLERVLPALPNVVGSLNGAPFRGLHDADDLFGPVLEVMARGHYYWVPLDQVAAATMNAPRAPRDLLWAQARLALVNGWSDTVFLPVLYPGSSAAADDRVKLGRVIDWHREPGGPTLGAGAHLFVAGEEEAGLLEWRQLLVEQRNPA